jgi:hypothetical protein
MLAFLDLDPRTQLNPDPKHCKKVIFKKIFFSPPAFGDGRGGGQHCGQGAQRRRQLPARGAHQLLHVRLSQLRLAGLCGPGGQVIQQYGYCQNIYLLPVFWIRIRIRIL